MWVALAWLVTVLAAYYLGWHAGRRRGGADTETIRLLRWQLAEVRTQLFLAHTEAASDGSRAEPHPHQLEEGEQTDE